MDVDGRMHVERCNISKACVNPYYGREIPGSEELGLDPNKIYNLYRDPAELAAAADSFRNLPLLIKHIPISSAQPQQDSVVGTIGSAITFEAPYLVCSPLTVWTDKAIDLVLEGDQEELSSAYRYRADMSPGVTPEGTPYDGVMRDIVGNHVALVREGRAGPDVVVADQKLSPPELKKMRRSILVAAIAPFLAADALGARRVAFDAAMEEAEGAEDALSAEEKAACDAEIKADKAKDGKMGADAEPSAEEKEKKYKEATDKKARDRKARDAKEDEEKKAADAKAAADKAARDGDPHMKPGMDEASVKLAVDAAEHRAVARVNALHAARRLVEPLVGVVAFDSAEEVHRFALKTLNIKADGVHASALPVLIEQAIANRAPRRDSLPAYDAAAVSASAEAIPGLSRFGRA